KVVLLPYTTLFRSIGRRQHLPHERTRPGVTRRLTRWVIEIVDRLGGHCGHKGPPERLTRRRGSNHRPHVERIGIVRGHNLNPPLSERAHPPRRRCLWWSRARSAARRVRGPLIS